MKNLILLVVFLSFFSFSNNSFESKIVYKELSAKIVKTKSFELTYSDIGNMNVDVGETKDGLQANAYAQYIITNINMKLVKVKKGYKWIITGVEWQSFIGFLSKKEFEQEMGKPNKAIIKRYLELRKQGRDVNAAWYYLVGQEDYDAVRAHEQHHLKQYNEVIPKALEQWAVEYNATSYGYSSEESAHKYRPDFKQNVITLNDDRKTKLVVFEEPLLYIKIALMKKHKLHEGFDFGHNLEHDAVKAELDFLEKKYGKN